MLFVQQIPNVYYFLRKTFYNKRYFFPDLVSSQIITKMMTATINTPVQTPALNIPPMISQLLKLTTINNNKGISFFIYIFTYAYEKTGPVF